MISDISRNNSPITLEIRHNGMVLITNINNNEIVLITNPTVVFMTYHQFYHVKWLYM